MDGVVDAAVAGTETAQQGAVGGVDNGVRLQPGNVPLPESHLGVAGRCGQRVPVNHAP